MKKKSVRRFITLLQAVIMLSCLVVTVSASSKAEFSKDDCCIVHLDGSAQTAKVRFWIHDLWGTNQSAKVDILMVDADCNLIWKGTVNSSIFGTTLKLGNDHSTYYIYMRPHEEPVPANASLLTRTIIEGNNFTNGGKCADWEFVAKSGCWIE